MATYPGVYRIKNVDTDTFMTMTSTGGKSSIICSSAGEGDWQSLWRLVVVSDGKHKLRNLEHNLEAHMGEDFSMIGEPNGHSWFIRDGTGDERIIHTDNKNVVLEVVKATNKVQLKLDKSQKNQRWIIEPASDPRAAPGVYIIKSVKAGTVMDLERSTAGEGVKIFGFQPNGGANQKWDIQPGSETSNVTIRSVATNAYAAFSAFEKGAILRSNTQPHEYIVTPADKGFYIAPVQQPDHVLDLSGGGDANETEICLWKKYEADHQKWYFRAA